MLKYDADKDEVKRYDDQEDEVLMDNNEAIKVRENVHELGEIDKYDADDDEIQVNDEAEVEEDEENICEANEQLERI